MKFKKALSVYAVECVYVLKKLKLNYILNIF